MTPDVAPDGRCPRRRAPELLFSMPLFMLETAWGVPTCTLTGENIALRIYIYIYIYTWYILLAIVPAWLPCDTLHQMVKSTIANSLSSAVASALRYWSLPINLRKLAQDAKPDAEVCSDETATNCVSEVLEAAHTPERNASPANPSLCSCHLLPGRNSFAEGTLTDARCHRDIPSANNVVGYSSDMLGTKRPS